MKKMLKFLPLVGLALMGTSCGSDKKANAKNETTITNAIQVKVEEIHKKSVDQTFEYTGTIESFVKNMISSQSAMRIEKIMVEVGDVIRKGQLLVTMEQTNYVQAKAQLENLKVEYERVKALYQTGGASKQQLDQMQVQLDVSTESVKTLEKNTRLLSPIDGVVTNRFFDNGDITGGQPILQVQQINPLKILINVSEEFFPQLKDGMKAKINLDVYQGEDFTGKISLIYPTVDPMTHTVTTEIKLDNAAKKIRPGMFARVTLSFGAKDRLVVSDKAIIKQVGTNDRYVYVVNDDQTVSYKKVILGQRHNDIYEVMEGLAQNDKVVIAGMSKLIEGTKVTIIQ